MMFGLALAVDDGDTLAWLRKLGREIRRVRLDREVTIEELAGRAHLSTALLSRIENAQYARGGILRRAPRGPRIGELRALAVALATSVEALLPEE